MNPDSKEDIAVSLVSNGFAMVEKRKEKKLQKLLSTYRKAQDQAKKNRVCYLFHIFCFMQKKFIWINKNYQKYVIQ